MISSISKNKYIVSSLIILLFESVYYIFSHEVHSPYMTFAFCYPLLFGLFYQICFAKSDYAPLELYNAGIITITLASILEGIVEIAGAYSKYTMPMLLFGIGIIVLYIAIYIFQSLKNKII